MKTITLRRFKLQTGQWLNPGTKLELMQMTDNYYKLISVNNEPVSFRQTISKLTLDTITTKASNIRHLKYQGRWIMTNTYPIVKKAYNELLSDPTINNSQLTIER